MKPQFSIVIPIYNAAATLPQALDSVRAQTWREFEVILVNDGSTDNCYELCDEWIRENSDLDVSLINQKNGGLGNARNQGTAKASHAWVAFLDADDYWAPQKLELIANGIQEKAADIYYHPVITFGLGKKRRRPCHQVNNIEELLIKGNPILPSATVGKTYLFRKYQFSENPDYHGAEDLFVWISMMKDDIIFERLTHSLTFYRETGGMSTDIERHLRNVTAVLKHFYTNEDFGAGLFEKAIKRKYWEVARFHHKRGNMADARKYYARCGSKSVKTSALKLLCGLGLRT